MTRRSNRSPRIADSAGRGVHSGAQRSGQDPALDRTPRGSNRSPSQASCAWAVNQVWWNARSGVRRDADRRPGASGGRLAAIEKPAAGKSKRLSVPEAAAAHRKATADAVHQAVRLSAAAKVSPTGGRADPHARGHLAGSAEAHPHGRLTESVQPAGFEALFGVQPAGPAASAPSSVRSAPPARGSGAAAKVTKLTRVAASGSRGGAGQARSGGRRDADAIHRKPQRSHRAVRRPMMRHARWQMPSGCWCAFATPSLSRERRWPTRERDRRQAEAALSPCVRAGPAPGNATKDPSRSLSDTVPPCIP